MQLIRLKQHVIYKPWGRANLPQPFSGLGGGSERVGEIWFESEDPAADELLVKYIFTSERLSVQVHPDDEAARAAGLPRGKDEAWLVLEAAQGATIGLGLKRRLTKGQLREAAMTGSIEQEVDWRPVERGQIFYSPAGTIHALGAGLTVLEVQQNLDCTYRLYDYGRDRELHIDDAVSSADLRPYSSAMSPGEIGGGRVVLADGGKFVLERWVDVDLELSRATGPVWLIPLSPGACANDHPLLPANVYQLSGSGAFGVQGEVLAAYAASRESAGALKGDRFGPRPSALRPPP